MAQPLIVSRVRTALYKQGYQGFTKEQILEVAKLLNININDPSVEDTKVVTNHLIQNSSSNITPSENLSENEETDSFISVTEMKSDEDLTEDNQRKPLDLLDEVIQESQPQAQPEVGGAITPSERVQIVESQAKLLGLSISDSDIKLIAGKINFEFDTRSEMINQVRDILLAFVRHRADSNDGEVLAMFNEVIGYSNSRNIRTQELFTNLTKTFGQQMEANGIDFKSSLTNSLQKYLSIPSSKPNS